MTSPQRERSADYDALVDELDATVTMLGRLFSARHAHPCEAGSLSAPQVLTLRVLAEAGPTKSGDVAGFLGIKAPATTALVDGLVRDGLVEREPDADDRRITRVCITDPGREALQIAEEMRREHMRRYMSVLSDDDIRTLIRIQRTLIDAMVSNRV